MAMGIHSSGGRRGKRRGRTPMADINVTPLVDVMLVLLIIFMITAPLLKTGVPVELPDSRAKALAEQSDEVTISLSRDGSVYLNDDPVAPGELGDRLQALLPGGGEPGQDGKPPQVALRADKGLDYGTILGVMGELNRAGFNSISMVGNSSGAEPAVSGRSASGQ